MGAYDMSDRADTFPSTVFTAALGAFLVLSLFYWASDGEGLRKLVLGNITLFETAAFILSTFFFVLLFFAMLQMRGFRTQAKILCFLSTVLVAGNVVVLFAMIYMTRGLLENGKQIAPTQFEAMYFSMLVFTGNGWGEFLPMPIARIVVLVQTVLSVLFFPMLISSMLLLFEAAVPARPGHG